MEFMNDMKLREYLALYGSDVESWPKEYRAMGKWAKRHHPGFASLIEGEKCFERLLLDRGFLSPHSGLAERIIAASSAIPHRRNTLPARMRDALDNLRPASFAAMLALGFAIGFGTFITAQPDRNYVQEAYADDEGTFP